MFREQYTKKIFDKVNIPEKEPVVVHRDGKLLPSVLKNEQCERIAIAISYDQKEQLLGVPITANSYGEEQAIAVYECLHEWVFPTPSRRCALTLQHPTQEDSKEHASYWSKC